jgi:uncharacterized protein (TIGR03437 family)
MQLHGITRIAALSVILSANLSAQANQGASFLFQLPGANTGNSRLYGYLAEAADLNADLDTTGPLNAREVIPSPDGQRIYIVAENTVQYVDANLQTIANVPVTGPIRTAKLTPDGRYLIVSSGQGFQIVNTITNVVVGGNLGLSGEVIDIVVGPDGTRAWILQQFAAGGSVTQLSLESLAVGNRIDLPRAGRSLVYSPQGSIFVATSSSVIEIQANSLQLVHETALSANPGPLHINLDGSVLYFVDRNLSQGYSVVAFRTATREARGWPANIFDPTRPILEDIVVAGNGKIYGLQRAQTTLWEINADPFVGNKIQLGHIFSNSAVFNFALSKEIPSPRYLFVMTENSGRPTLMRVALGSSNLEVASVANTTAGPLQYAAVPPQSGAGTILKYNDNQTLPVNTTAKKLFAFVTDSLGRPVFNAPVQFRSNNVSITGATLRTNANGYLEATAQLPASPGTYTVEVTAGAAQAVFTLTATGAGGGGGGGGGGGNTGNPRMSMVRGDGMMLPELTQNPQWTPLTVKVVDETGKPEANVAVQFTQVEGPGSLCGAGTSAITDVNGLASTTYCSGQNPIGSTFSLNTIRATSVYGSVEFAVTTIQSTSVAGGPAAYPAISPQSFFEANVNRGEVITDFYQTQIRSVLFPQLGSPIPNIGLRVAETDQDYTDSPAASCVNNTKSDNNGLARCDLRISCSLDRPTQIQMMIGELLVNRMVLNPQTGTGRKLALVTGNNQSGNLGQALSETLIAQVTDSCNAAIADQDVTWTVTQGAATLSQVVSRSGSDGRVSARLTLGQTAGPVRVTVSYLDQAVTFSATVNVTVSRIQLISGGGQTAVISERFANPVVFALRDPSGASVGAGQRVTFSVTSPSTVTPTEAETDAQGLVQTNVFAGINPGTITVRATFQGLSEIATLTVRPVTLPLTAASFVNAASGAVGLVPCGLASVTGLGLAPHVQGVVMGSGAFGPLPYALANVALSVGGRAAPLQSLSNIGDGKQQLNFQVPCELPLGTATVEVTSNGTVTSVAGIPVYAAQPGLFTWRDTNGQSYGAVVRAVNGSYVTPTNPARTGESLYMIVTGLGQVTPATVTNSTGTPDQTTLLPAIVGFNNGGVPTQAARYLQGLVGVYYVEFTIPRTSNAPVGTLLFNDAPLVVYSDINGTASFSNSTRLPSVVQGQQ